MNPMVLQILFWAGVVGFGMRVGWETVPIVERALAWTINMAFWICCRCAVHACTAYLFLFGKGR